MAAAPKSPLGPLRPKIDDLVDSMSAEFKIEFSKRKGTARNPDPVLVAMFYAFATHIDRLYNEADDAFPTAVLDDLLSGLALTSRAAQPAQTVLAFHEIAARTQLPLELSVGGVTPAGEPMVFSVDYPIELTTARLAFAGIIQDNECFVISDTSATSGAPLLPRRFAVPPLRDEPASLFLAIETDARHLSRVGLFLEVGGLDPDVVARFSDAPWFLLGPDGVRREDGVMRTSTASGGVRRLRWATDAAEAPEEMTAPAGPYGSSVFVFPEVPPGRRWSGLPPLRLRSVLPMLNVDRPDAFDVDKLTWVEVALPGGSRNVATLLECITLNCTTASNLDTISQTLHFDRTGGIQKARPEGADDRHLVSVVSVIGEFGDWYSTEGDLDAPLDTGRHRLRDKVLEVRPHKLPERRRDGFATARLLLCDGERANEMDIATLRQLREGVADNPTLQVSNPVVARGGGEPLPYAEARVRFADLVRTRERIVTSEDVSIAARAFDRRLTGATVSTVARVRHGVLTYVDEVVVELPTATADRATESARLRDRLFAHLKPRWMIGRELSVRVTYGGRP